jgi:Flp pilus assembly protein TadD
MTPTTTAATTTNIAASHTATKSATPAATKTTTSTKSAVANTQPKAEPATKTTKTEPKAIAKTEKATTKTAKAAKAEPKTVAKAEPKGNYEAAYRTGLQQFARGETSAALASLRSALAGNPNYAPTWRGLGLVFEKMGERDQARAAFRRYLQLAPGAGDADNIRGRLERLGS